MFRQTRYPAEPESTELGEPGLFDDFEFLVRVADLAGYPEFSDTRLPEAMSGPGRPTSVELAPRSAAATAVLRSLGLGPDQMTAFFRGEPVVFETASGVIGIAQLRVGSVRVGIFSINVPQNPAAALRGFSSIRAPARALARAIGASSYELFGAAVRNPAVEAMLLRQGFIRSIERVPESLGLGPAADVEVFSRKFPVTR